MKKLQKAGLASLAAMIGVTIIVFAVAALSGFGDNTVSDDGSSMPSAPSKEVPAGERATFISAIDGDTIKTSAGTVRIIGIDTPERGECGYEDARDLYADAILVDAPVYLNLPDGQNGEDRYGRLIRYVATDDIDDIGMLQLTSGHAVARYNSKDGYPKHPREAQYERAQQATFGADGRVMTVSCASAPQVASDELAPAPTPSAAAEVSDENWWQQYSSCAMLKRNTVGHPIGPFNLDDPAETNIYNWFANGTGHNGDGDGDGLACE